MQMWLQCKKYIDIIISCTIQTPRNIKPCADSSDEINKEAPFPVSASKREVSKLLKKLFINISSC